jgi:flagellar assembly protein FliH
MSSSSEAPPRGRVLRGGAALLARPARMDSELSSSPFAAAHVVDARLTDPHLQDVVDSARRSAVEQGHAEGFTAGYAAGLTAAAADAELERQRVHRIEQEAAQAREQAAAAALELLSAAAEAFRTRECLAVAEIEQVVTDLALQVARAVLDRELELSAAPGREAVARALRLADPSADCVVRLNPQDAALVGDLTDLAAARSVTVVADPAVELGGCVVDGAGRSIDAQIGSALARVAVVLR